MMRDSTTQPEIFGDALHLPFSNQRLDAVTCSQVLEHGNQPEQVIREIYRILKTNGEGIISVPFIYKVHGERLFEKSYP